MIKLVFEAAADTTIRLQKLILATTVYRVGSMRATEGAAYARARRTTRGSTSNDPRDGRQFGTPRDFGRRQIRLLSMVDASPAFNDRLRRIGRIAARDAPVDRLSVGLMGDWNKLSCLLHSQKARQLTFAAELSR